jgi:hypothetical protein
MSDQEKSQPRGVAAKRALNRYGTNLPASSAVLNLNFNDLPLWSQAHRR